MGEHRNQSNLTETRDLVSSSRTPAFSRYFLNSSFLASWVIFDIVTAEEGNWSESKSNLGNKSWAGIAACFFGSTLALTVVFDPTFQFLQRWPLLLCQHHYHTNVPGHKVEDSCGQKKLKSSVRHLGFCIEITLFWTGMLLFKHPFYFSNGA